MISLLLQALLILALKGTLLELMELMDAVLYKVMNLTKKLERKTPIPTGVKEKSTWKLTNQRVSLRTSILIIELTWLEMLMK